MVKIRVEDYSRQQAQQPLLRQNSLVISVKEGNLSMMKLVALPSAAPQVLTGFWTSIGRCWMIVVGVELFGASGVGYEIINASNNLAMATSVAYMFLISLVFLCMDVGFRLLERRVLAWR